MPAVLDICKLDRIGTTLKKMQKRRRPLYIHEKGRPCVVIMSFECYRRLCPWVPDFPEDTEKRVKKTESPAR